MRDALLLRVALQLTMAVRNADRADMVPLGEQQLQDHRSVFAQSLCVSLNLHALGYTTFRRSP
jgi:hypothetical protein